MSAHSALEWSGVEWSGVEWRRDTKPAPMLAILAQVGEGLQKVTGGHGHMSSHPRAGELKLVAMYRRKRSIDFCLCRRAQPAIHILESAKFRSFKGLEGPCRSCFGRYADELVEPRQKCQEREPFRRR